MIAITRIFERDLRRSGCSSPLLCRAIYRAALIQTGVHSNTKHFPASAASLKTRISRGCRSDGNSLPRWTAATGCRLNADDYRLRLHHARRARLTAIDKERARPRSPQKPWSRTFHVADWKHRCRVLVTDDFNMGAVYASDVGIGEASVLASMAST